MKIHYLVGNATEPQTRENTQNFIVHVCNDIGVWGAGFVLALSKKWNEPKRMYEAMFPQHGTLGCVSFAPVEENLTVVNMIAQHGIRWRHGIPPIRYAALSDCLESVGHMARCSDGSRIHMPRIGCGLAGGQWEMVEPLIKEWLYKLEVYVYDLPK